MMVVIEVMVALTVVLIVMAVVSMIEREKFCFFLQGCRLLNVLHSLNEFCSRKDVLVQQFCSWSTLSMANSHLHHLPFLVLRSYF